MEFFNQLLTSYSLLKKRNLRISLDEARGREKGISGYNDLYELSQKEGPQQQRAVDVLGRVDAAWKQAEGIQAKEGEGTIATTSCQEIVPIRTASTGEFSTKKGEGETGFKNKEAVCLWDQSINQAVVGDGGGPLNPSTEALLDIPEVQQLVDYKPTEEEMMAGVPEDAGLRLIDTLAQLAERVADHPILSRLMDPNTTGQASIPVKVRNSLMGDEFRLTTEDKVGTKTAYDGYQQPDIISVTNSLKNLNRLIELHEKVSPYAEGPMPTITQDDVDFINSKVAKVVHIARGKGNRPEDRVFVKSNINDSMGFSYDFRAGKGKGTQAGTIFNDLIKEIEEGLELAQDKGLITLPEDGVFEEVDIEAQDSGLNNVVGDLSEDMPAMVTLLMDGTPAGRRKFKEFWDKLISDYQDDDGHKFTRAFKLDNVVDDGFLVATEETAVLNKSLDRLKRYYGDTEAGQILRKISTSLMNSAAMDMLQMKPDYSARVGKTRAGAEAKGANDKTDVVLFYKDEDKAQAGAKTGDSPAQRGKVTDLVQGEDLEKLKELYPELAKELDKNPDHEMWYTNDNMKCTSDGKTTNAGSTSGPKVIAEQFINPDSPQSLTLMEGLGDAATLKDMGVDLPGVRGCFETVLSDMNAIDDVLNGIGSASVSKEEAQQVFIQALGPTALEDLGIDEKQQEDIGGLLSEINGAPTARNKLRAKLQQGLLTRRLEMAGDGPEGANWRAAGALNVMRGCYDGNNGSKVVYDYAREGYYRYNNNKPLMKSMRAFIKTGEGFKKQKARIGEGSSMSIAGYRGSFTGGSESVGMKWTAPVHGKFHSVGMPPTDKENSSTEYSSTELMNKLLEVQQLIFSS
jgi:hypothetical protein